MSQEKVSTSNSTITTLSAGSVFTGTSEDIHYYHSIVINVQSDRNSSDNGLSFEFSTDRENWDTKTTQSYLAKVNRTFHIEIKARFFRIVYTNGTVDQGLFRLQTIFTYSEIGSTSKNLMSDTYVSDQVQGTVIAAVRNDPIKALTTDDNQFTPLQVNKRGELYIDTTDLTSIKTLLEEILVQLKISNLHNEVVTDNEFKEEDIDE